MRMMKRGVAKMILLAALVLSAFSIAGAVAAEGKDGGSPIPTCGPGNPCDLR